MTESHADRYWNAIEDANVHRARKAAHEALDSGMSLDDVLTHLVVASQQRVGLLWQRNDWTVAREHSATTIGEAVVRTLGERTPRPDGPVVLVACVAGEWHALPAMLLTEALRMRGVNARFLGGSISHEHLLGEILDHGPRAVLVSASLSSSLARCRRQIEAVRGSATPVVVGGQAFDAEGRRARQLGANAQGNSADDVLGLLETLPSHATPAPALTHRGADEALELQSWGDALAADVLVDFPADIEMSPDALATMAQQLPYVIDTLVAALMLEEPRLAQDSFVWLDEVLVARGAPEVRGILANLLATHLSDYPLATRVLNQIG